MKLSLGTNQFFDDDGTPLNAGRITVCAHDSDTKVDLYTLEGDTYVISENPLLTSNDGRVPGLYFDAQVVDVKVEKNVDGVYETLDTYNAGFSLAQATVETRVDTVADLDSIDPAASHAVTVLGYYAVGDAPARTYVWDAGLTQSADGGYLLSSSVDSNGRWVLLWDSDVIPASVYGVFAGSHEENMSRLLGFASSVGSFHEATARTVRFPYGTYTTSVALSTDKVVMVDNGTVFNSTRITCDHLRADQEITTPVGRFFFRNVNAPACLSWFSSMDGFLRCGSRELFFDDASREYEITENVLVTDKVLHAGADTVGIEGTKTLTLNSCTFVRCGAAGVFSYDGPVRITNCHVSDRDIDCASVSCTGCQLDIDEFDDVSAYVSWARSNGITVLDLKGRTLDLLENTAGLDIIRNGAISELDVDRNVTLQDLSVVLLKPGSSNSKITMTDCTVSEVYARYPNWTYEVNGSTFLGVLPFRTLTARDSRFNILAQAFGQVGTCSLVNCIVDGNVTTTNLAAQSCTLRGTVWTREYADTITCSFIDCDIVGTQVIKPGDDSEATVKVNGAWLGNRWIGAFLTVTSRYDDAEETDYLYNTAAQHSWMYVGNTGNCIPEYSQATALKVSRRTLVKPAEHWGAISFQLRVFGFGNDIGGEYRLVDHISADVPVDAPSRDWVYTVPRADGTYTTTLMKDSLTDYWSARLRDSFTASESSTAQDETVTAYVTLSKYGVV